MNLRREAYGREFYAKAKRGFNALAVIITIIAAVSFWIGYMIGKP